MKNPLAPWSPHLLSVLRIMAALLLLSFGTAKNFDFPHNQMFDHLAAMSLPWFGGLIELIGGALLTVGLFSRIAAFIVSGEMAVIYFIAHAPRGFHPQLNGGVLAILFCFIFLYIAAAGPGPWSIDALRKKA